MLRFSLQLSLFLFAFIMAVMLFPIDAGLKYKGLKNDCFNHASWMYDRLYQNEAAADIAFIGSSHTINAINDSLIGSELQKGVLNFGYCRHGRNLDYLLAKELIQVKKPRYLIVEVRAKESKYSHPIFPYLADNSDLLSSYPWLNQRWFSSFSTAFQYRLQLIQETLWTDAGSDKPNANPYGFRPKSDTIARAELELMKQKRTAAAPKRAWLENLEHHYPLHYVEEIAALCKERQVELIFLYLPAYGIPNKRPLKSEQLQEQAAILIPPQGIFQNPSNWFDENHLNRNGAMALSQWLSSALQEHISSGVPSSP